MSFPISEKAGCVWCCENAPCVKVGFRLFCKPWLQRNIPLIFYRGVYALLCLLWVINEVTNLLLFKVKGRILGSVITNLFSVWQFSLKNPLTIEVQQSILWWLVSLFPSWSDFAFADRAFSPTIQDTQVPHQSHILHCSKKRLFRRNCVLVV